MTDFYNELSVVGIAGLAVAMVILAVMLVSAALLLIGYTPGEKVSAVRHYDDHVKGRCAEQRRFIRVGGREYREEVRNICYERASVWSEWRWTSTRYVDSIDELNF